MVMIDKDAYVWIPDNDVGFLPAITTETFEIGKPGNVKILLGNQKDQMKRLEPNDSSLVVHMDTESIGKTTFSDMVKMKDLKESSILHNLHMRFRNDDIYTGIGDVLVSVNPFKQVSLFDADILDEYATNYSPSLPPHIYGVASRSYRSMIEDGEDQSCLVSGESGAGKSEAAKIFMHFLAEVSGSKEVGNNNNNNYSSSTNNDDPANDVSMLQEKILKASPILEAFGNAKTVRNKNSSRFGKWLEIRFQAGRGTIVGGTITQYLLEKTRITNQSPNERNYHIFYQICAAAAADVKFREKYRVMEADQYAYLEQPIVPGEINDERGWQETLDAMNVLKFSPTEIENILRTVAGVLQLGNITFEIDPSAKGGEEVAKVSSPQVLELVAFQFGVKVDVLGRCLTSMELKSGKEVVSQRFNIARAIEARNVLARAVFGNLFEWIVVRINASLNTKGNVAFGSMMDFKSSLNKPLEEEMDTSMIGVLDIFGFESFLRNSFEQLCINYCNERLQSYFTEHIFKLEQQEYIKEGVDVSAISYTDNNSILELIDTPRVGVFGMIDEEGSVPRGSDESLLNKLQTKYGKNTHYIVPGPKMGKNLFGIVHYAGEVFYEINGFISKNKDTLPPDFVTMSATSGYRFFQNLFKEEELTPAALPSTASSKKSQLSLGGAGGILSQQQATSIAGRATTSAAGGGSNKRTLAFKFKMQLDALIHAIACTKPHFIRCVKPNSVLKPNIFQGPMVLAQLRYSGLLDVSKIRQQGYPARKSHDVFVWRYRPLLAKKDKVSWSKCSLDEVKKDPKNTCLICAEAITNLGIISKSDWQVGNTKILMKANALDPLEMNRAIAVGDIVIRAQAVARGYVQRKMYKSYSGIINALDKALKSRKKTSIDEALLAVPNLPHGGQHLKIVKACYQAQREIDEENRQIVLLNQALNVDNLELLSSAVLSVNQAMKSFKPSQELLMLLKKAEEMENKLRLMKAAIAELHLAVESHDLGKLQIALQKTPDSLKSSESYTQALAMKTRLEIETSALKDLENAIKSKKSEEIKRCVDKVIDLGLGSNDLVAKAQKLVKVDEEKLAARKKEVNEAKGILQSASAARDISLLSAGKTKAIELGILTDPEVNEALQVLNELLLIKEWSVRITGATDALNVAMKRSEGLRSDDIDIISKLLDDFTKASLPGVDNQSLVIRAQGLVVLGQEQLKIQQELLSAVEEYKKAYGASKKQRFETSKLIQAIQRADGIHMGNLIVLSDARTCLRQATADNDQRIEEEMKEREKQLGVTSPLKPVPMDQQVGVSEDEIENRLTAQLQKASNPAYEFIYYHRIRSDVDFFKGVSLHKDLAQVPKLKYQDSVLHKSILVMNEENNKSAIKIHKSILGYCGDIMMNFPAQLAQAVLKKGIEVPALVDEIYIQLMKQINGNPNKTRATRVWHLICLCVGCFAPSNEFELYLINFLLQYGSHDSMIGRYAEYALRRLHGTMMHGSLDIVPGLHEIQPYADRPPVLASIELVDGTAITYDFPIAPHMNVDHVLQICCEFLALNDPRSELFGMFVSEKKHIRPSTKREPALSIVPEDNGDLEENDEFPPPPPPLPSLSEQDGVEDSSLLPPPPPPLEEEEFAVRNPYPLQANEFLGDIVLRLSRAGTDEKFVFKKKLFLEEKHPCGKDPVYNRLIFLQAMDEIICGNWKLMNQYVVVDFVALALSIDLFNAFPSTVAGLLNEGLMDYIPVPWRSKNKDIEWASMVLEQKQQLPKKTADEYLNDLMLFANELPMYGCHTFYVRESQEGEDVVCTINNRGISLYSKDRELVQSYLYSEMEKFGGSSNRLIIRLKRGRVMEVVLWTSLARELASLILQYTQVALQRV